MYIVGGLVLRIMKFYDVIVFSSCICSMIIQIMLIYVVLVILCLSSIQTRR